MFADMWQSHFLEVYPHLLKSGMRVQSREGQALEEAQPCGLIGFGAVVEGQEGHEVARSFSALLQLVNNGNVQLNQGLTTTSPFSLQLRSLELQQDRMAQRGASELILSKVELHRAAPTDPQC